MLLRLPITPLLRTVSISTPESPMYNVSSLPAPTFDMISLTMDGSGFGGMPSR